MEVNFYQAECGDAASIRYFGNDNKYHNIFIDSGYSRTFRYVIEEVIQKIIENNEKIDLWVISHIHDDHIGGIVKYIDTIQTGEYSDIVEQFLYNPPREYESIKPTKNISEFMSIDQGDTLYEYIKSKDKLLNFDITNSLDPIDIYGLKLSILSPSKDLLKKLRNKYKSTIKKLEKEEDELISEAVTPSINDYKTLLSDFNLNQWQEDNSVENGSSIAVLSELDEKKVLWLADAHPNIVVESIKNLGYTVKNKLRCDWVKIAHHGSRGNNSNELFSLIDCNNFLFSANGENKYNLPTKECISRLLRNTNRCLKGNKYNVYFTYDNNTLRSIFENEEKDIFEKYHFKVIYSSEKLMKVNL